MTDINNFVEQIPKLSEGLEQIKNEIGQYKEFVGGYQKPEEKDEETKEEAIERLQNVLKHTQEHIAKRSAIKQKNEEFVGMIDQLKKAFEEFMDKWEEETEVVVNENNETIDELISLHRRVMVEKNKPLKEKVKENNKECHEKKNQLKKLLAKEDEEVSSCSEENESESEEVVDFVETNQDLLERILLNKKEKKQVEEWTGMECGEVIFDTEKHAWSDSKSEFIDKIFNRTHLTFVVEDTNGNKFGYYLPARIDKVHERVKTDDAFLFTLRSNGRVEGMHKFEEKRASDGFSIYNGRLFDVNGGISLFRENKKNESYVHENDERYNFHGMSRVFHADVTGGWDSKNFVPKRIVVIQMLNEEIKKELNEVKPQEEDQEMIDKILLNGKEKEQIEEWTDKDCGDVIFDSNNDEWSDSQSVFIDKLMDKSNLTFVIEDTNGNKFGYYLPTKIDRVHEYVKSSNSFLFTLRSNGRVDGMYKFEEKSASDGFSLYNGRLFDVNGGISLFRENQKGECYVHENNERFDFHGKSRVFHADVTGGWDSKHFVPKRIVVIQMVEQGMGDGELSKKILMNRKEKKQVEQWTELECGELLFDSDKDDWYYTDTFYEKVYDRRCLLFVFEDTNGNKFGGYLHRYLDDYEEFLYDSNAFVFSLNSKGRLPGMMKFEVEDPSHAFWLWRRNDWPFLFKFGEGTDIDIWRKGETGHHCKQMTFNYHGYENALCGCEKPANFQIKRFVAIQMK